MIHLLIARARIKIGRSHLSVADLERLAARGGRAAGPAPLPAGDGSAFEVERVVNNSGLVGPGGHQVPAAEILGGRQVGIRIDDETLSFFDMSSRKLLRVRSNLLTSEEVRRLRGLRPAGRRHGRVPSPCVCSGGSARWAPSFPRASRSYLSTSLSKICTFDGNCGSSTITEQITEPWNPANCIRAHSFGSCNTSHPDGHGSDTSKRFSGSTVGGADFHTSHSTGPSTLA